MSGNFRDFVFNNKKRILIVAIVAVLIIIGVSIFFIIRDRIYSVTLNIVVSPSIAKVKVGDDEYEALGTHKIKTGEYDVEIYADGFVTKTGRLVAVEDETVEISVVLQPTEDNSDWYDEHPWDATAAGDIRSDEMMQEYQNLQDEWPILKYVPHYNYDYTITYEEDCEENGGEICLVVDAGFGFSRFALQYLQLTGLDLSSYYVKGVENPFIKKTIDVPDGLAFENKTTNSMISDDELTAVDNMVKEYISDAFNRDGYGARILQTKKYDDRFFGVTIAVSEGNNGIVYDIYRMIIGHIDGEWMLLTDADVILSKNNNPGIPSKLLRLFNSF